MNKKEFVAKHNAWNKAIIKAEQEQQQKLENLKKTKENRRNKKIIEKKRQCMLISSEINLLEVELGALSKKQKRVS